MHLKAIIDAFRIFFWKLFVQNKYNTVNLKKETLNSDLASCESANWKSISCNFLSYESASCVPEVSKLWAVSLAIFDL